MLYQTILLCVLIQKSYGYSMRDEPPKILEPSSYINFAIASRDIKNGLTCEAENADNISWEYKSDLADDWGVLDKSRLSVSFPTNDSTLLVSKVEEVDHHSTDRYKLTGYYRCFATSYTYGNTYKTVSAPIKLIYSQLAGPQITGVEDSETQTRKKPVIGQPYSLPCFRDASAGPTLKPPDSVKYPDSEINFQWVTRRYGEENGFTPMIMESKLYKNRVRKDPLTGRLYFAYLRVEDGLNGDEFYMCQGVTKRAPFPVFLNQIRMKPAASSLARQTSSVVYPTENKDKTVKCIEGIECKIVCIFGGSDTVEGSVTVTPPTTSSSITTPQSYGVSFMAEQDDTGTWTCTLKNTSLTTTASVDIQVVVLKKPRLVSTDQFVDRYAENGTEVTYICEVKNVKQQDIQFYINGKLVTTTDPPYVTYESSNLYSLVFKNVQREHSTNIVCIATNEAGTYYGSANLNVFDKPKVEQFPTTDYRISSQNSSHLYEFNCSFTLDPKANRDSIELYWRSSRKGLENRKIKNGDQEGVNYVGLGLYSDETNRISSSLQLEYDGYTESYLINTTWTCVLEYTILESEVKIIKTKPTKLIIPATPNSGPTVQPIALGYVWVIVGVLLGLIFLILLLVLIHCYIQTTKGEQYYVDKHERKAGHNPEEELQNYQFKDYKRPDQDPIKASQDSMNFSEKTMESDTGSMDEYGDIAIGRFNEDGSFIGQYGLRQPQNQIYI